MKRSLLAPLAIVVCAASILVAQQPPTQGGGRGGQRPPRDRAARRAPTGTATIAGRVLAADTGRPLKHANVVAAGSSRYSRGTTTDDQGRFQLTDLPADTYTVRAIKNGFVDGIYGQRRPLQPGTPIDISDGQQLAGVDLRLTRGGVITGRVLDEDGEPLARALVTVQRYEYVRGERQLAAAGADQTDDRGAYRVFGLAPGTYYVSCTAQASGAMFGGGFGGFGGRGRGGPGFRGSVVEDPESTGYAPTYYPGVASPAEAARIVVAPGQEVTGMDFQLQLVPLVAVDGIVIGASDSLPVMLVPEGSTGIVRALSLRSVSRADGTFSIPNVPPGRYIAIARSGGFIDDARMARQRVVVNGQPVSGVALALQAGVTVTGNITVESAGTAAPTDYSVFRIDMPDVDPLPVGPRGRGGANGGRAEKNGAFSIANLMPGAHDISVDGHGPWALKSITINGQDVTDTPIELQPNQDLDGVTVVMTDRTTTLAGTVHGSATVPAAGLTVVAFSTNPQFWRAQSRYIQSARTDQNGSYTIRGLPPGTYQVIALDDVETDEWFDPSFLDQVAGAATTVTLNDGQQTKLDLPGPD